jgi:tetratricopeptide (TPR) repeat protein
MMPLMKDRRGQVLSWDEVHAEFADAAKALPIEAIDRELEAMGYDLGAAGAAVRRLEALERCAAAVPVPAPLAATGATAQPPAAPRAATAASAPQALRQGWSVLRSSSPRTRSAAAGVFAAALVAVLALPMSQSVIGRWLRPTAGKIEKVARPASAVEEQVQALIQSVQVASDPLGFARNLNKAGQLLEAAHRSSDAVSRYFEAIALFEDHSDKLKPSPLIAAIAHNLARLLLADDRLNEAEKLLERALEINLMHFGPDHPIVARDIASLDALQRARSMCAKPLNTCAI